ncbi:MAG: hypothetical protein ACR2QT_07230 [Woeseiaceae bacterium]
MKHSKTLGTSILGAAALFVMAGPATAAQGDWSEIQSEINSCVAAVADHADYSDATHVRHAVVDVKERTVGYKLSIETSIFTDAGETAIREYATSCVVNGDYAPMKFAINESFDDA